MFRPLLVRPSSGWTQRSEELYNNAILSLVRGDEISFKKNGACLQTGNIEIYALLSSLVCGNIFIHYW